ncbi:MAG TPA: DUF1684 domain-containing protein [Candidatus Polarisedimenticolia bacterium]|nr:DUF1684 domain-containing protein [Candidatus Polarisedimenticolia bacterium]
MSGMLKRVAGSACLVVLTTLTVGADTTGNAYRQEIEKWRQDRETRLKSDTGWLTVAGLYWLKEGANRFGSDPAGDIVLPAAAPPVVGDFVVKGDSIMVKVQSGATVTSAGEAITELEMKPDNLGEPTELALGDMTMFVIQRGGKYAIRLRDKNSPARKEFTALKWYPIKPEYRVTAKYTEYVPAKQIPVPNILGMTENLPSPGYVTFVLNGKKYKLDPVLETPDAKEFFFIFKDKTSGETTYTPGRFLYAAFPVEGKVLLDFNKAYNPPCAFTRYATCPLPPSQNRLEARIEAGELKYGNH